jgi:hypothetical protein
LHTFIQCGGDDHVLVGRINGTCSSRNGTAQTAQARSNHQEIGAHFINPAFYY